MVGEIQFSLHASNSSHNSQLYPPITPFRISLGFHLLYNLGFKEGVFIQSPNPRSLPHEQIKIITWTPLYFLLYKTLKMSENCGRSRKEYMN